MNPTDNIKVKWDSELLIRALFNITKAGVPNIYSLGPEYADSMSYEIIKGTTLIKTGVMPREVGNEGKHQAIIDTGDFG